MSRRDRSGPSEYFAITQRTARSGSPSHLISIRLPDDLLQRLAVVGNEESLSMSDTIRLVLERGLTASDPTPTQRRKSRT
jgi:hypothetical protein